MDTHALGVRDLLCFPPVQIPGADSPLLCRCEMGKRLVQPFQRQAKEPFFLLLHENILRGFFKSAQRVIFNSILPVKGEVRLMVIDCSDTVIFLPEHEQEGLGHFIADLHKHILLVAGIVIVPQIDRFHGLILLKAERTGSFKLLVLPGNVLREKFLSLDSQKTGQSLGWSAKYFFIFFLTASMLSKTEVLEQPHRAAISA